MSTFDDLQQAYVSSEMRAIGLQSATARLFQPGVPVPASDADLWALFNAIPTAGGAFYAPSTLAFFSGYSTLINALVPGTNPLDPVKIAQSKLAAWGSKPPTWNQGVEGLSRLLQAAPHLSFSFNNPATPDPGYWGLWGNSSPITGPSDSYAAGAVSVSTAFKHLLSFTPIPGDWYVSTAMSLAYRNKTGAPWNPSSPVTWQTTFGEGGMLQQLLSALVVVSGVDIGATSSTSFTPVEQALISAGLSNGLWPHYLTGSGINTKASFNATSGQMTTKITSTASTARMLFAVVMPAQQYLGL